MLRARMRTANLRGVPTRLGFRRLVSRCPRVAAPLPLAGAPFATAALLLAKQMPPRPKPPPEEEIQESYLKGSGPGGQKINKTSSAVQLKHVPTGLVVKSQATRSRDQNRKVARELLAAKLDDLRNGDRSRSALVGDIRKRKAASAAKKSRRKYRKLEDDDKREAADNNNDTNSSKQPPSGWARGEGKPGT